MPDDFQRLVAGNRRAHHLLDIPSVAYFQSVHGFICSLLSPSMKADGPVIASAVDKNRRRGILDTRWSLSSGSPKARPGGGV
jgi:hypothetical protein